jgi:hypothetical protein
MARGQKLLMSFALLFFLFALFLADLRVRYILPIVPPLVILLTYGVFNVYLRIKQPAYLFVALFCFASFNGYYLWRYFQDVAPLGYLTGQESRTAYLTRALPEYLAFQYVNRELSPAAKIYLLFVGRRGYYCEREYFHDGGELPVSSWGSPSSERTEGPRSPVQSEKLDPFLGQRRTPNKISPR